MNPIEIDADKCIIGNRVIVYDNISGKSTSAAIAAVEYDNEYNIYWLYLINLDIQTYNDKIDPKLNFMYWDLIENVNENIVLSGKTDPIM